MKELHSNTEIEGMELPTQPGHDEQEEVVTPEVEGETTELSDEERSQFQSLLTIGQNTKKIDVLGHPVIMKTMTVTDELMVGLESKKYKGSEAFARAYQSAVTAVSVVSLGGKPLYTPLSPEESESEIFQKKLDKVHSLYPIVVSEIYRNYMEVEREFAQLAKKLGKLSG